MVGRVLLRPSPPIIQHIYTYLFKPRNLSNQRGMTHNPPNQTRSPMAKSKVLTEIVKLIKRTCLQVIREHPGFLQLGKALKDTQTDVKELKSKIKDQDFLIMDLRQEVTKLQERVAELEAKLESEKPDKPDQPEHLTPERLLTFRSIRRLSQETMAKLLDAPVDLYGKWERGESVMASAIEERFLELEKMTGTELREKMQEKDIYMISGKRIKTQKQGIKRRKSSLKTVITAAQITDLRIMLGKTPEEMNELFDPEKKRFEKWQAGKAKPPFSIAKELLRIYDKEKASFEQKDIPSATRKTPVLESPRLPRATIRTERERMGMSRRELGEKLGVSGTTVSNWENGNCRPSPEMIDRMLVMFGSPQTESAHAAATMHVVTISPKDRLAQTVSAAELRKLRNRIGLTMRQMAQLLNVRYSRYCNWETEGRCVPSEFISLVITLQKMSDKDLKERIAWLGKDLSPAQAKRGNRRKKK